MRLEIRFQRFHIQRPDLYVGAFLQHREAIATAQQEVVDGNAITRVRLDRMAVQPHVADPLTGWCRIAPGIAEPVRHLQHAPRALRVAITGELLLEKLLELRSGQRDGHQRVRERVHGEQLGEHHAAVCAVQDVRAQPAGVHQRELRAARTGLARRPQVRIRHQVAQHALARAAGCEVLEEDAGAQQIAGDVARQSVARRGGVHCIVHHRGDPALGRNVAADDFVGGLGREHSLRSIGRE